MKKKYAIVGTGGRCRFYLASICARYPDQCELVALCDISQVRMDYWNRTIGKDYGYSPVPTFHADQFSGMLEKTRPDVVIVTSKDSTHHHYIVGALEAGCKAITEKPMTIDAEKCRMILDAVSRTGKPVQVAFNYRWATYNTKVKELLMDGVIGSIKSIHMEYLLNTSHGADYYRRWHSRMSESGGLLVHKATHHFDLVNWWVDAIPETVFAFGDLVFYGRENAIRRGDEHLTRYPRYTGHVTRQEDPFALDLTASTDDGQRSRLEELYHMAEEETGYLRDQNVFREDIDIYDTMSVNVRYRNGVLLTYSLNSFSPREGMRVTLNGDRGRLEYYEFGGSHIITGQSDAELEKEQRAATDERDYRITIYPHFRKSYSVQPEVESGGHGGSDPKLQGQIFDANAPKEKLGRLAGHEQGAASILIGIAANESIRSGLPVRVSDLAPLKPEATRLSELV